MIGNFGLWLGALEALKARGASEFASFIEDGRARGEVYDYAVTNPRSCQTVTAYRTTAALPTGTKKADPPTAQAGPSAQRQKVADVEMLDYNDPE